MTKITIERETLEMALAALGEYERHYGWRIGPTVELRAALAVQPAEAGMVYPPKPPPRHCGYIPDGSGVEWNAYDTMQMEAYARMAYAAGFAAGFAAAQPAPAAVPPGYVLVPIEPTPEMVDAGDVARHSVVTQARTSVIYRAMIAAAGDKI